VWFDDTPITLEITLAAREVILGSGGDVYVWTKRHGWLFGGIWMLEADTMRPTDPDLKFERLAAKGFDVFLDLGPCPVPERLVLELRGRRSRIAAYWNNQSYVF
jgi:hypothetical protein